MLDHDSPLVQPSVAPDIAPESTVEPLPRLSEASLAVYMLVLFFALDYDSSFLIVTTVIDGIILINLIFLGLDVIGVSGFFPLAVRDS